MKKQFICMLCEKRYAEMEEAEMCERKCALKKAYKPGHKFFGHCEKCDHLVSTRTLEPVQTCKQTMDSPAEYEDWCEECRGVETPRDEAYERAAARDRADNFARTGGKDWT